MKLKPPKICWLWKLILEVKFTTLTEWRYCLIPFNKFIDVICGYDGNNFFDYVTINNNTSTVLEINLVKSFVDDFDDGKIGNWSFSLALCILNCSSEEIVPLAVCYKSIWIISICICVKFACFFFLPLKLDFFQYHSRKYEATCICSEVIRIYSGRRLPSRTRH